MCLTKVWTAIDWLLITWKSNLFDKIKRNFFQAAVVSSLMHRCTSYTLKKRIKKKLDENCTRMIRAILNKTLKQHPTKQQLFGHLPPIPKTIQIRRSRHMGHCWRRKDELISDILLWTSSYGRASVSRPTRAYLQQFCTDTGYSLEDLLGSIYDRDAERESWKYVLATWHDDADDDILLKMTK